MCLTSPMSFTACPHGQKLSKYAQHKYQKEDSRNFRCTGGKGSLKLSLSGGAPSEFQVLILYKHTYTTANLGYWKTATFQTNSQGLPRQHGDNNLSIEIAVLLLSNTRYHRRIIVTRSRKSFSGRRTAYKPTRAYRYSHYGELHDSNGAQYKEEFKST